MTISDASIITVSLAALGLMGKMFLGLHNYDKNNARDKQASVSYQAEATRTMNRIELKLDDNTRKTGELLIESREHFASDREQFRGIDKRLERLEP